MLKFDKFFDTPAIFDKILPNNLKKKLVKSQHAMFSHSRQKGEAEDNSDDDINEDNEF